ncbi:hypothetical protein SAG0165_09630, partial [Streptococcus agalactiae MRI Z1-217]
YKKYVYLCAILDLYSRKCIAWKLSHRMDAKLACDTLELALNKRKIEGHFSFIPTKGHNLRPANLEKLLMTTISCILFLILDILMIMP